MKDYIVSARKYRPLNFDSVVGQKALTTTLKNSVKSGKLAHAYLFCGPRGVGKTTCARIFAKAINCLHPTENGEACGLCESCKAFNEQRSYNVFELDAASNNSVEAIKDLMEQTRIPPQVGKYKVFIIDEVHMLTTAAFNAFLKTLEEPPAHVIFILATTEKHKILPTIISRCQIYDFERIKVSDIVEQLKMVAKNESITYEEEALNLIAEKADGGMRDALSTFDQAVSFCQGNLTYKKVIEDLNVVDADNYFKIIDFCLENKAADVMVLLNSIINRGFDGGGLINGLAVHARNVLMAKDEETLPLLQVSQKRAEKYKEQAKKCPTDFLYKALKIMNKCDINYRQSNNKRLLVELTLIEIAQITQSDDDGNSAGRGPKRLKCLFKHIINVQPKVANQVATAEPPVSRHTLAGKQKNEDNGVNGTSNNHETDNKEHGKMAEVMATKTAARKPALKLGGLSKSFANLKSKNQSQQIAIEQDEVPANANQDQPFSNDDVSREWIAMCVRMTEKSPNLIGIASRMKNMTPIIKEFPHIEAVVDNGLLLDDMTKIKGSIRNTLALRLQNSNITFTLRLAEPDEIKPILTNKERFELLKTNYKAFGKLSEMLHLELN